MLNEILTPRRTAVVISAAGGIGLAAIRRFAGLGMNVVLADLEGAALDAARLEAEQASSGGKILAVPTDVSNLAAVEQLREITLAQFGDVAMLMNNAAIPARGGKPWEDAADWRAVIDVNLMGVVHCVTAFTASMIAQSRPGLIVNTGSKQGITNPPGAAPYNASKAARPDRAACLHPRNRRPACQRSSADPGLDLHRHNRSQAGGRQARRRLDTRAGDRLHDREPEARRLLHSVSGQCGTPRHG